MFGKVCTQSWLMLWKGYHTPKGRAWQANHPKEQWDFACAHTRDCSYNKSEVFGQRRLFVCRAIARYDDTTKEFRLSMCSSTNQRHRHMQGPWDALTMSCIYSWRDAERYSPSYPACALQETHHRSHMLSSDDSLQIVVLFFSIAEGRSLFWYIVVRWHCAKR